eukprot:TRINITY_DN1130_c0_g2_i2.p1 TRINITY_DN1130_c0_g2~~TRINITY_DN1130_c0_g2_i2.p1  ORF type:complete len:1004 (+),score=356.89 TRINITY_DN1130_c0_g2_i2:103-3114(+)
MADLPAAVEGFFKVYAPDRCGAGGEYLDGFEGGCAAALHALDAQYKCTYFAVRSKLVKVFAAHDPGKSPAFVDQLMGRYAKKEDALLQATYKKYPGAKETAEGSSSMLKSPPPKPKPKAEAGATPGSVQTPKAPEDGFLSAVKSFFTLYDAASVAKAPAMVEKFRPRREDFCYSLDKKYGKSYFALRAQLLKLNALAGREPRTEPEIDAFLVGQLSNAPPPSAADIAKAFKASLQSQPAKPAENAAVPLPGGAVDWTARIKRLYEVYDAAKAAGAATVVAKYQGKEVEVWKQLVKKYGPEPEWVERLARLVGQSGKAVDKKGIVEKLVEYAGREEKLLQMYVSRYGPEPAQGGGGGSSRDIGARRGSSEASPPPYHSLSPGAKVWVQFWVHAQEKLASVPALLAKHAGAEGRLVDALAKKHGKVPFEDSGRNNPPGWPDRMAVLYAQCAPEKLASLPALLVKYEGNEPKLLAATVKKYNATELWGAAAAARGDESMKSVGGVSSAPPRERVVMMYRTYQPEKMKDVPALLAKYAGKEEQLVAALVKKYGPEPVVTGPQGELPETVAVKKYYMCFRAREYGLVRPALEEWLGRERDLLAVLVSEYGALPKAWPLRALDIWEDEYPHAAPPASALSASAEREEEEEEEGEEAAPVPLGPPPVPRRYLAGEFEFAQAQRLERWDLEDDEAARFAALVLAQTNEKILARQAAAQRQVAHRSVTEHLESAYKRWLGYLSWRISAVCDLRDVLYDKKLSVYNQIQTNKFSILAHKRQERSRDQRAARRTRDHERALTRLLDQSAKRHRDRGVRTPGSPSDALPDELAVYRHVSHSPPFSPPPGAGLGRKRDTERSEWDVAKSTAELALAAEERRQHKADAEKMLRKLKDDAEAREAAARPVKRTRTPRLKQQLPRGYHNYSQHMYVPTSCRSPSPAGSPRHQPLRASSPTIDDVHSERVRAARRREMNNYVAPDAMFYARTLQRATHTPETTLERELRKRKERARDFPP